MAIKDGIIQSYVIDADLTKAERYYDAKGNLIFPGVVECHAHLGNRTRTNESVNEDLYTETRAAAQGGITTCNSTTLKGTLPLHTYYELAQENIANIYTNFKFTVAPASDAQFAEMEDLVKTGGPCAFKLYLGYRGESARMFGMDETGFDTGKMYWAFSQIAKIGPPAFAIIHAEDPSIFELVTAEVKKELKEKPTDNLIAAYNKARPSLCEVVDICKAAIIANEVGCPLYIAHISAKESVDQVAYFLKRGFDITVETCLHYLLLSCDDDVFVNNEDYCKFAKVNPPIRGDADRERLWQAIREGIITCVGTDSVAYTRKQKLEPDFWDTICGCGDAYYCLLPLMFSEGVNKNRISLDTLRKILCENPAKRYGIYPQKGTLNIGSDADITIIDPNKEMVIDYQESESSNEFSLYQGWKVKGVPVATFVNGYLVAENMKIVDETPHGKLVHHNLKTSKIV
ncbi:MAG: amidohydrolase family protein [Thermacetogeniaceae bacterium]